MYIVNPREMTNTHIKIRGLSNKPIVEIKWNKKYLIQEKAGNKEERTDGIKTDGISRKQQDDRFEPNYIGNDTKHKRSKHSN